MAKRKMPKTQKKKPPFQREPNVTVRKKRKKR